MYIIEACDADSLYLWYIQTSMIENSGIGASYRCFLVLLVAKTTTSYASGKEELIARKKVDKIKTPY